MPWPRILIIGNFPPPEDGGLPSQGELLGEALASSGARIHVLSRKATRLGRLLHAITHTLLKGWAYDVFLIQIFSRRARFMETAVILAGRLWRKRLVLCMRSGSMPHYLDTYRWLTRSYRLGHRIVFPSEYLRQACDARGLHGTVIPNFIPLNRYDFHKRRILKPRLLFLRTFHPMYNPELALKAFAEVKKHYPDAALTMAGINRGYEEEVRKFAKDADLHDVRFLGFIPKTDIPSLMNEHDILLNTPHIDNMPVTVLEAMACGLIVISTCVGGIPFLLRDGGTALFVRDDDAQDMAAAVARVMKDPDLAEALCVQGRRLVEEFTWEKLKGSWAEALSGREMAGETILKRGG